MSRKSAATYLTLLQDLDSRYPAQQFNPAQLISTSTHARQMLEAWFARKFLFWHRNVLLAYMLSGDTKSSLQQLITDMREV